MMLVVDGKDKNIKFPHKLRYLAEYSNCASFDIRFGKQGNFPKIIFSFSFNLSYT